MSELEGRSSLGGIFDLTGVTRGPDGVKRYDVLPANLVAACCARASSGGAAPRPSRRPAAARA